MAPTLEVVAVLRRCVVCSEHKPIAHFLPAWEAPAKMRVLVRVRRHICASCRRQRR